MHVKIVKYFAYISVYYKEDVMREVIMNQKTNLHLKLALLDMEEYRLLNGWSRDKKKGSERYDRIPVKFAEEVCIDRREDYMQFVPYDLPEQFTAKDFAKHAKIPVRLAQTVLLILTDLEIVVRVGKQGKSYLYEVNE